MKTMRTPALAVLLLAAFGTAYGKTFEFAGEARAENGDVLYTEHHRVVGECSQGLFRPLDHRVEYRDPAQSEAFADKVLRYQRSPVQPEVDFDQPRFDESLRIAYPGDDIIEVDWQMPSGETRAFNVPLAGRAVVDAGFDNLVRQNWSALQEGRPVEFRFLGPTRGELFGFILEPSDHPDLEAHLEVAIRPTSMLLRFLVDPIQLGYNSQGALTHYLGLTNIRKNPDTNYQAHIRYDITSYPECELTP
ncbi:hypothetical protein MD273_07675 [Marinobacter pelagius]|uniref:hypothetical protein n=1 Tax=Marinobacter sp. C7 TaxID=2951363 RepID=UPI001EF155A4|nr:hypothetical protein [Marinobacter sp. C7]MCG7199600.1 hypothetical protein [Marinobacter sp. C7]